MSDFGMNVLPHTSIAATSAQAVIGTRNNARIFYQNFDGFIQTCKIDSSGTWEPAVEPFIRAMRQSPLAAVSYDDGTSSCEVFWLDEHHLVRSQTFAGDWRPESSLYALGIEAAENSSLAAFRMEDRTLRLFVQEASSDAIQEVIYQSSRGWTRGATLAVAMPGTSLSAVTWGGAVRIYYQASNLTLQEYAFDAGRWIAGAFRVPKGVLGCTPIHSMYWSAPLNIRVFYYDEEQKLLQMTADSKGSWGKASEIMPSMQVPSQLASLVFNRGDDMSLIYQSEDLSIIERYTYDQGKSWTSRVLVAGSSS